ncbi:epoxide hydrolase 1-like [Glandiceps talaboti]
MGIKLTIGVLLVAIVIGTFVGKMLMSQSRSEPPEYGDGWWGRGERGEGEEDTSIRQVNINVPDTVINDLKLRLGRSRRFEPLEDVKSHYGFNANYMQKVVDYWMNSYDWKKQQAKLNQFEHFKTYIEGIDVHYIHVKPRGIAEEKIKPLLMIHGWPGSIIEFYKILPMLTDPLNHGGTEDDAFEVICPSIPGYGFSEAPHKQGFDMFAAARVFDKLMVRLGFESYYVQGGDWGSGIGNSLGLIQPSHVLGYHTNLPMGAPPFHIAKLIIGSVFPTLVVDEEDIDLVFPAFEKFTTMLRETGYMHLQATKPDTPGFALNDSPVGLAAYILEKFCVWTNLENLDLEDGGLEKYFTLDEVLTNVMIYWVNGNIASSMRFYKESVLQVFLGIRNYKLRVPTGIAMFKNELFGQIPHAWAKQMFPELVSYTRIPTGGHFAALEVPELLAEDFRQFVRKVEEKK